MTIGNNYEMGVNSYVALFKESTYGTYPATVATGASTIEPLTIGIKTEIESQKLETISMNRGATKRVQLNKNVSGSMEQYLHPTESPLLMAVCMGGGIVTSSLTGAYTHSLTAGNFDTTPSSISMMVRKGATNHWQYTGGRVNQMTISGNVGEVVKVAYEMIFRDSTQAGTSIVSSLSISSLLPFTYVDGSYRYAATEAALTSTASEKITGFELVVNNNMKSDADARGLGSNVIDILPPTRRTVEFKITQRFDTTTAWNRFVQNTQGSIELLFQGATITADNLNSCRIVMPKVFVNTPDPEVTGPNDLLMSEISFDVLVDNPLTTTGKDIAITFINDVASY